MGPDYIPYRWCNDIEAETQNLVGTHACYLGEEYAFSMLIRQDPWYAEDIWVFPVTYPDDADVVWFYADVVIYSGGTSWDSWAEVEMERREERDRTRLLQIGVPQGELRFFSTTITYPEVSAWSDTPIGDPNKHWTVEVAYPELTLAFDCPPK